MQIERGYVTDEEADDPEESADSDPAPQLVTSREDFDLLMNEFLDNFEVLGGKLKPALPGIGAEKLETLRSAMGYDHRITERGDDASSGSDDEDIYAALEREDKRDRWDVETILSK